jgi:uncharacterized membrane protein YccC
LRLFRPFAAVSPQHRAWLRQAARTLASVFLSDLVARAFGLGEPYWALITAVIVTSNSFTSTWAAGRDQIVGTLIGAAAGAVAIGLTLLGFAKTPVFVLMLVPLTLLAAARPTLRLTCVTLIVVFLFPSPGNPFARPFDRVSAILIGAGTSLLVSYLVFRPRARRTAFAAASSMLSALEELLREVMSGSGPASRDTLMETATAALRALGDAVIEARREHVSALELSDPLLVRLVPMLRRLQSDVLFVTRAMDEVPDARAASETLRPAATALAEVFEGLRRRCDAIAQDAPGADEAREVACEIMTLDESLASLGDIAGVPLRFTLQMLRRDLDDMENAIEQDREQDRGGTRK